MPQRSWSPWLVAAATAAALMVPAVIEAVWVSPTAVFLDDTSRNAQVTIGNSSDEAEEVTIVLRFGYLDTDSLGTPFYDALRLKVVVKNDDFVKSPSAPLHSSFVIATYCKSTPHSSGFREPCI